VNYHTLKGVASAGLQQKYSLFRQRKRNLKLQRKRWRFLLG